MYKLLVIKRPQYLYITEEKFNMTNERKYLKLIGSIFMSIGLILLLMRIIISITDPSAIGWLDNSRFFDIMLSSLILVIGFVIANHKPNDSDKYKDPMIITIGCAICMTLIAVTEMIITKADIDPEIISSTTVNMTRVDGKYYDRVAEINGDVSYNYYYLDKDGNTSHINDKYNQVELEQSDSYYINIDTCRKSIGIIDKVSYQYTVYMPINKEDL